jgi:hypothetical protein
MKYRIPANLDLVKIISENPPKIRNFRSDKLIVILDLINTIPAANKDVVTWNGFVPIQATILQKSIAGYKAYLNYLINNKIILCDNYFLKGQKSLGYKFADEYKGDLKIVEVDRKKPLMVAFKRGNRIDLHIRKKYQNILKYYNRNLKIDFNLSKKYLYQDLTLKLRNVSVNESMVKYGIAKDPNIQYKSAIINVEKLTEGNYALSIDSTANRLHSVMTNMPSPLRNLLTYQGKQFVSVDIKNCQPFLSSLFLSPEFWKGCSHDGKKFNINRFSNFKSLRDFLSGREFVEFMSICESADLDKNNDIHRYLDLVQFGNFYENMGLELSKKFRRQFNDRKIIKEIVFQVLFTDNRFIGQREAEPKRMFKSIFPTVYSLFNLIKKADKTLLPILLLRIESHLILDTVCKRITRERPDLPIFTIHDSVITIKGEEDYVDEILWEEIVESMGYSAELNIEHWSPDNLKFTDGTLFNGSELTD